MIFLKRYKKYIVNPRVKYGFDCYTERINYIPIGIFRHYYCITFIFSRRLIDLHIQSIWIQIFTIGERDSPFGRGLLYANFKHRFSSARLEDMWSLAYFGYNAEFNYNY